jgi:Tfp pilus assembly protein PilF
VVKIMVLGIRFIVGIFQQTILWLLLSLLVACASGPTAQIVASQEGQVGAPSATYQETSQTVPKAAQTLLMAAQQALDQGDSRGAERYIEKAQRLAPSAGEVYALWGAVYATEGQLDLAQSMYQRALALFPGNSSQARAIRERLNALR